MRGFSVTNLKRIKLFALAYPDVETGAQLVHQLPWGHIVILLSRIKDSGVRLWYAKRTLEYGWSRSILEMQIEIDLYGRQGVPEKKISNYHQHLPTPQSDLANQLLKDPYNFDFLTIGEDAHERAIEDALITHIKDFLLELGQGFCFCRFASTINF